MFYYLWGTRNAIGYGAMLGPCIRLGVCGAPHVIAPPAAASSTWGCGAHISTVGTPVMWTPTAPRIREMLLGLRVRGLRRPIDSFRCSSMGLLHLGKYEFISCSVAITARRCAKPLRFLASSWLLLLAAAMSFEYSWPIPATLLTQQLRTQKVKFDLLNSARRACLLNNRRWYWADRVMGNNNTYAEFWFVHIEDIKYAIHAQVTDYGGAAPPPHSGPGGGMSEDGAHIAHGPDGILVLMADPPTWATDDGGHGPQAAGGASAATPSQCGDLTSTDLEPDSQVL